jgi:hypothetical protein
LLGGEVVEGRDLEPVLDQLLARPEVASVHVRNARPGCFVCAIVRA